MQQSRGSPIPPNMIPAPAGTRLSRCSTTSSARYYSRSSLGSSSSNTSGRSRSISATYQRADKTTACSALFAKRASTGSHLLLRKAVGRSTNTITIDDAGYESDFEEEHTFDPVDSLRIRFNKSPKTPTTLRALRIMEQRTGTSSIAPIDMNNNNTTSQIDDKRRERKPSVEDWSDDYDIPESAERIVVRSSHVHIRLCSLLVAAFRISQTYSCIPFKPGPCFHEYRYHCGGGNARSGEGMRFDLFTV